MGYSQLLKDLENEALSELHAGGSQQCAHRSRGASLLSDYLAQVLRGNSEFKHDRRLSINLCDRYVVRIIDERFAGMPRSRRHEDAWQFLSQHAGEDAMSEVSALLLFPTAELRSSLANLEFEDPVPSGL